MNELINIMEKDGQLVVSSRQVAENFEKQHKDVLESICKLISQMSSAENSANLFIQSEYADKYGRMQKEYLMTRDGFSLLVMGFTGNKALEWKLKYIEAFNHMEAELNSPERIMARALKIAEETTNRLRIDNSRLTVENQIMQPKAEYFDELVDSGLLSLDGCLQIHQILGAKLTKTCDSLTPITVDVIDAVVEGEEEVQELEETQEEILDAAKPVEMQGQGAQVAARAGKLVISIKEGKDIYLEIPY